VIDGACGLVTCDRAPRVFHSNTHALELEYAFTRWLTVALTPRVVTLTQDLRPLTPAFNAAVPMIGPRPDPDGDGGSPQATHGTGGIGDTDLVALLRVFETPHQHLQVGLGFSLPSGEVDYRLNGSRRYLNYALQTGSGTLDFTPSLTLTGRWERLSWGGQLNGVTRLEARNATGYALGDRGQITAWGGVSLLEGLTASIRGVYTTQGAIAGKFKRHLVPNVPGFGEVQSQFDVNGDGVVDAKDVELGPVLRDELRENPVLGSMDAPRNYGGQSVEMGFGLSWQILSGPLAGNAVNLEWVQPVAEHTFGYQLERTGSFSASWQTSF
jgi:hypothetical protein